MSQPLPTFNYHYHSLSLNDPPKQSRPEHESTSPSHATISRVRSGQMLQHSPTVDLPSIEKLPVSSFSHERPSSTPASSLNITQTTHPNLTGGIKGKAINEKEKVLLVQAAIGRHYMYGGKHGNHGWKGKFYTAVATDFVRSLGDQRTYSVVSCQRQLESLETGHRFEREEHGNGSKESKSRLSEALEEYVKLIDQVESRESRQFAESRRKRKLPTSASVSTDDDDDDDDDDSDYLEKIIELKTLQIEHLKATAHSRRLHLALMLFLEQRSQSSLPQRLDKIEASLERLESTLSTKFERLSGQLEMLFDYFDSQPLATISVPPINTSTRKESSGHEER